MDQPVGGQHHEPRVVHAHERHEPVVEGGVLGGIGMFRPHHIAVGQRRLVAVVPVGDDQRPAGRHRRYHRVDHGPVGHHPETLLHLGLDHGLVQNRRHMRVEVRLQQAIDRLLRVGVEHKHVAPRGLRRHRQREPVHLGAGQRPLVREHHTLVEPRQLQRRCQPTAHVLDAVGRREPLLQHIQRRLRIADQHLLHLPQLGIRPCPRIHIACPSLPHSRLRLGGRESRSDGREGVCIFRRPHPLNNAHEVVGRLPVILGLLLRVDAVIRLRDRLGNIPAELIRVISEASKWPDLCHLLSPYQALGERRLRQLHDLPAHARQRLFGRCADVGRGDHLRQRHELL